MKKPLSKLPLLVVVLFGVLQLSGCGAGDGDNDESSNTDSNVSTGSGDTNQSTGGEGEVSNQNRYTVEETVVIDSQKDLMFINPPKAHLEAGDAVAHCEGGVFDGHTDWYLPTSDVLSEFHREMNKQNVPPAQMFGHCAAEIGMDGYVRTAVGAGLYGGQPGDPIGFRGAANVRCGRDL